MANSFSKEERVAFEAIMDGFEDYQVMAQNVSKYKVSGDLMERANDIIWRPMPYIATSQDGPDITGNYQDANQLSVPATLGYKKAVGWTMTAAQLRDSLQEGRLGKAAAQRLASDINVALLSIASLQGTLFVKRSTATGFADVAACETIFNETGVPTDDRYLALSTANYNAMAALLAATYMSQKAVSAYERAYVGRVASFETYKLDYANSQALSTASSCTLNAANQYFTPKSTDATQSGKINYDNRYQTITTTGTQPGAGDAITIAGVYAVHHITKQSTGNLKSFRVISVPSATTLTISPPIITGGGGTDIELQYKNCYHASGTPATTAAITGLNTVAKTVNPFWHKDAIELLPGGYMVPTDAGVSVMRGTTESGISMTMTKFFDIDSFVEKYRIDVMFGVVCKQPEMCGVMMLDQT